MAGGEEKSSGPKLTGLARIFNSETNFGRANVAKATYATIALVVLYCTLKPKKK